jgi:hypothetical protein
MNLQDFNRDLGKLTDRTADPTEAVQRVLASFAADAMGRNPDVDDDGETAMDFVSFMMVLLQSDAVINLPTYRRRRVATVNPDEIVVSAANRHGRVLGLTSNQHVWSMGVNINDANVMTATTVGASRTFLFQDITGEWYDEWSGIDFRTDNFPEKLRTAFAASEIKFTEMVSRNRGAGVYGRRFILAKAAITRLADRDKFLKAEAKRLAPPVDPMAPKAPWSGSKKVGTGEKVKVWAFNCFVDTSLTGDYTPMGSLEEVQRERHRLRQNIQTLRFCTRATEFGFWKDHIGTTIGHEDADLLGWLKGGDPTALKVPAWCPGEWTTGVKAPGAKTFFAALRRPDAPTVRWRAWRQTEEVAAPMDDSTGE